MGKSVAVASHIMEGYTGSFDAEKLSNCRILVISNALHETNITRWHKPVLSAFTPEETETVKQWQMK